jgi:NarL family two-component system response regulator LiaR
MSNDVSLSSRELEVVRRIVEGKKYREIAQELRLGYETVKTYASRIRKKLGVHSKTEIATWYLLEFCEDDK